MNQPASMGIEQRGGILVVVIHGRMMDEPVCTQLRAELVDGARAGEQPLVVDLSEVRILPSMGIGVLLEIHKKLAEAGRQMIIAGAQNPVRDVFRLTRVDQVLELSDSLEEAVQRVA